MIDDADDVLLLGGDHAGLHATFASRHPGSLVRVPERLVPPAMLEWDDVPICLETLTSEDWTSTFVDDDGYDANDAEGDGVGGMVGRDVEMPLSSSSSSSSSAAAAASAAASAAARGLRRTVVTVMPEVGCGIDNLEWIKRSEEISFDISSSNRKPSSSSISASTSSSSPSRGRCMSWRSSTASDDDRKHDDVAVIDREGGGGKMLVTETIFRTTDTDDGDVGRRRIRLSLSLSLPERTNAMEKGGREDEVDDREEDDDVAISLTTSDLIDLYVERRVSRTSTGGNAWTGKSCNAGGLDARTVSDAIGRGIVYGDAFAARRLNIERRRRDEGGGIDVDDGDPWTLSCPDGFVPWTTTPSVVNLRLPQNLMIRYGRGISSAADGDARGDDVNTWSIEISHHDTIGGKRDGESPRLRRRVVLRSFDDANLRRMVGGGARDNLGDILYWVEVGALDS